MALDESVAQKATGTTWTNPSDRRLKEDILPADLNICYSNIKNIPLRYYKLRDEYITEKAAADRHKVGWIAQEVQSVFPKAVITSPLHGIEDCLALDADQLFASMYGAIQKLQGLNDAKDAVISDLVKRIEALEAAA